MVFRFVQNVFFGQHTRVRIFIFFDENLTLGYMTKTLNHKKTNTIMSSLLTRQSNELIIVLVFLFVHVL
jgi:hypothetical protein